jgi:glutamyl-tRNA reductase
MNLIRPIDLSNFFVAGINYKKTDAEIRGLFAINAEQYELILASASSYNIDSIFILSTCNRTEIFGFAEDPADLVSLLCSQTKGDKALFNALCYIKEGNEAVDYLFNVGAGLESQILGDYEIIGQLKQAVNFSKDRGYINCFMDRLFNYVVQASKSIKNGTALSGGTISVSFAAIQYIKESTPINQETNILVVGIGKIGRNTCKNLVYYLGTTNITLINRSEYKAAELARELKLKHAPINELAAYCHSSNIILLATNAGKPIILKSHLQNKGSKIIIDLSVPNNIAPSAAKLPNVKMVNVDALSKRNDETLQLRAAEIPRAKKIIADFQSEFMEWYSMRKNALLLNAIKNKLTEIFLANYTINTRNLENKTTLTGIKIQKVINSAAGKMKSNNQFGCYYLEAINEFMHPNLHGVA